MLHIAGYFSRIERRSHGRINGEIMTVEQNRILSGLTPDEDGIFSYPFNNRDQAEEILLRESVADHVYDDYLSELSRHHSIPVMDREIERFLRDIPENGSIVDVGGCWGWHWRNLHHTRPDIRVYVVDFIRSNLVHAKNILHDRIGESVFLIHGDATDLVFEDNLFDGYWSVQTLQHIPDFESTIREAFRVLKSGGIFANYSLNIQSIFRLFYRLLGKNYHIEGYIPGRFYLARASSGQIDIIKSVFSGKVTKRYSEILFKPEIKMSFSGRENSITGIMDSRLSNSIGLFSGLARQQSFHTKKA